jgi:hypothetical protein
VPGDLYAAPSGGSLGVSYVTHGARVVNFSWGATSNTYSGNAEDVDNFLNDHPDALVFISAGNASQDADNNGIPDSGTLGTPATAKNALAIGASRATNLSGSTTENRAAFSSVGPAPGNRVAPQLMAPGDENLNPLGIASEFHCRSNDNNQTDPALCDLATGLEGTSFSSPAAAGAALLVRDYFAQGFYPDGTRTNASNAGDLQANVSGPLVKSILIASADFMTGTNLTKAFRFNNEQGYGRIVLSNALPLEGYPPSANGLAVTDGAVVSGENDISGLTGDVNVTTNEVDAGTFVVCDDTQELRIALSWFEAASGGGTGNLINNINLEVESPSGDIYYGNYFTDDDDRNGAINLTTEDCPSLDGTTGTVSNSQWSLPVCTRANATLSPRDTQNPTEAVFLSPDPLGDGSLSQVETGTWNVRVRGAGGTDTDADYAIAIAGGVCLGSTVKFDSGSYACNETATVTVTEKAETGDMAPTTAQVSARTTIQVLDPSDAVVDSETGLTFTQTGLQFEADAVILTDGTQRDPGNGVLDVRSGDRLKVLYADVNSGGSPDPNKVRSSFANVNCTVNVNFGGIEFAQFGRDSSVFVAGGCERNARGQFERGFPDRYMDEGELISLDFAFASDEQIDLENVEVSLRCAVVDGDSPETCRPNSADCADPNRLNNPICHGSPNPWLTILDSPKVIGSVPAGSALSANFSIQVSNAIPAQPEVDLVLEVQAATSGKTASGIAVSRHKLDTDESSVFYSTDFPTGGVEIRDRQNNEVADNPWTQISDPFGTEDYIFDTWTYSDLTAGGTKNTTLGSPWNFDINAGNFQSGIAAPTDDASISNTIAQWGEDKNFNGIDDRRCTNSPGTTCVRDADCPGGGALTCQSIEQRDAPNATLDRAWARSGGCGWVTKAPNTCAGFPTIPCYTSADCPGAAACSGAALATGGAWHTGRIGGTTGTCLGDLTTVNQCQRMERIAGTEGQLLWMETLVSPQVQKVNGSTHEVEFVDFEWNQAVDLPDSNVAWGWEVDTDSNALEPADLFDDTTMLNLLFGAYFATGDTANNGDLTTGFSVFAPLVGTVSQNGTVGNNRQSKNPCWQEGGVILPGTFGELGIPRPPDDDLDNDGADGVDEYVTRAGPIRNMDLEEVNGPDMRFSTLEDIYGDSGDLFQAGISIINLEGDGTEALAGPGLSVDDAALRWREFTLVPDATDCVAGGSCAVVDVQSTNLFQGNAVLAITVLEKTPDTSNDCNYDGTPDPGPDLDCDNNGTNDVVVKVTSDADVAGEIVFCNATGNPGEYKANLPMSTFGDSPGVLYLAASGSDAPTATVLYLDNNDGTGSICENNVDPNLHGRVLTTVDVFIPVADVEVIGTLLTDNVDVDGFADTNETVDMRIRILNNGNAPLENVVARLASNDPKIDCIISPTIDIGTLPPESDTTTTAAFTFRVAGSPTADRAALGLNDTDDFSATFSVVVAGDGFDGPQSPQSITIQLDLDASGGSGPSTYFEGFEGGTLGTFSANNIDSSLHGTNAAADGYRCQYHDPDWIQSNSYGLTDCYLGATPAQAASFFWAVHTTSAADNGRAFNGQNSLHMGILGSVADDNTTPLAVLEAVQNTNPINLGWNGVSPDLTFKQQVSFIDGRALNMPDLANSDRGVVSVQLANSVGTGVGNWIKLNAYANGYDTQNYDNYGGICFFDPIDDGNTEDTFFDPADPLRRLGPSSTCFPAFAYSCIGNTFSAFSAGNICNSAGPGLQGSLGKGTWIESKFSLNDFRGRRIRLRFLNTAIKLSTVADWDTLFGTGPLFHDDGWWVDDVQITHTLTNPATIAIDTKANLGLPACGATCNTVTAFLGATPGNVLPAPGQVVELSAANSTANRCLDGTLQFQFRIGSTVIQPWSDKPDLIDAPTATTTYTVDVRCSTLLSCADSESLTVTVECPSSGNLGGFPNVTAILDTVPNPDQLRLTWGQTISYNFAKGLLSTLPTYSTAPPGAILLNQTAASSVDITGDAPASGNGFWYLFRKPGALGGGAFCNESNTWGSPGADAVLP